MTQGGSFRSAHPLRSAAVQGQVPRPGPSTQRSSARRLAQEQKFYLFVVADEMLPSGKLVRKLLVAEVDKKMAWANPSLFGMQAKAPGASVSIAEHSLGNTNSSYISTSTHPDGAQSIDGKRYYIDIKKAKAAGVIFHEADEILADIDRYARENPSLRQQIEAFKKRVMPAEAEVLLEGRVPASAIKSAAGMLATKSLQVVQWFGVAMSIHNLGVATEQSFEKRSYKPIAAESIRQVGGWAGAISGGRAGAAIGTAIGSETGPGALLSGAIGFLCGMAVGYFGLYDAEWVVKETHLDKN